MSRICSGCRYIEIILTLCLSPKPGITIRYLILLPSGSVLELCNTGYETREYHQPSQSILQRFVMFIFCIRSMFLEEDQNTTDGFTIALNRHGTRKPGLTCLDLPAATRETVWFSPLAAICHHFQLLRTCLCNRSAYRHLPTG